MIVAKSPGKKPWHREAEVPAGAGIVTVEVPRLETENRFSYGFIGAAAIGAGGNAVGTISALAFQSENSDAKSICASRQGFTSEQVTAHDRKVDDARRDRTWSYVGFGVAVLGLAGAAALLFLPPPRRQSAWVVSPAIGEHGAYGVGCKRFF